MAYENMEVDHGMPEGNESSVLTINAPSLTAEYRHQRPKSGPEEKPEHSEMENSNTRKEELHSMICRSWLWQLKWKKILEVISLSCIIITIWVVFMIPSIIFAVTFPTAKEVSHISEAWIHAVDYHACSTYS